MIPSARCRYAACPHAQPGPPGVRWNGIQPCVLPKPHLHPQPSQLPHRHVSRAAVHATMNGNDPPGGRRCRCCPGCWRMPATTLPWWASYTWPACKAASSRGVTLRLPRFQWSPVPARSSGPPGTPTPTGCAVRSRPRRSDGRPRQHPARTTPGQPGAARRPPAYRNHLDRPWFISVNPFYPHPLGHRFTPPASSPAGYDPDACPARSSVKATWPPSPGWPGVDFQTEARRPAEFDGPPDPGPLLCHGGHD